MRWTLDPYAKAAASIWTKNKVSLAAGFGSELASIWAIGRIDAFDLSGHSERIFRGQADVVIRTIPGKGRPYWTNGITGNAARHG